MATRKKADAKSEKGGKATLSAAGNASENGREVSPEVLESDRVISEIISDLGSQGECLIYRRHRATGPKEAYIDSVPAEVVTPEWIKDTYGGGHYRLQFKGPDESGRGRVYRAQARISITEEIPPKVPSYSDDGGAGGDGVEVVRGGDRADPLSSAMNSQVIGFMRSMSELQVMQMESLKAIVKGREESGPGVLDKLVLLTPLLAPLVTALVSAISSRGESTEKTMEIARQIGELVTKNQAPTSNLKEMAETLTMLRELSGKFGGGESDPAGSMLAQIAPAVVEAITKANARESGTSPGATPRPAPTAITPAAQTGDRMGMLKIALTPYAKAVVSMARRGKDAELQGTAMADNVPETMLGAAQGFVAQDNAFEQLMAMFPEFAEHREWVAQWFVAFRATLLGEGDEEPQPEGDAGAAPPAPTS